MPTETPIALPTDTPATVQTETPAALPTETPAALPTETPAVLPTETTVPRLTPGVNPGEEVRESPPGAPNPECWRHDNWPEVDCSDTYLPGHVIVGFKRDVTKADAVLFLESLGLSFEMSIYPVDSWAKIASGPTSSIEEVIDELSQHELVKEVRPDCYGATPAHAGWCITVQFIRYLSSSEVEAIISSFDGLSLIEDSTPNPFALICVEPGTESELIQALESQDPIEYAQLNGIARTPEQCMPTLVPETSPTP